MLSVPEYGQTDPNSPYNLGYAATDFSLGEAKYELTEARFNAVDWLKITIHGLKNQYPFTLWGDCEPGEVFCTVAPNFCHIIFTDEGKILKTHMVEITMLDFCRELHADISKDTFEWAYFIFYGDEFDGDEYREEHLHTEKIIQSLLDELAALIKDRSKYEN